MKRFASKITGLVVALSVLFPSAASAMDILKFDTASGNGSLFERIVNGTIEPRVREIQTIKVDGKPVLLDKPYEANMRELFRYADAYSCRAKLNFTICKVK